MAESTHVRPVRKLTDKVQMPAWQASEAHSKLLTFVQSLSKAVQGHATTDPCHESEAVQRAVAMLERIEAIAADTPLEEQDESRFGNKAFRTFHQKFTEASDALLLDFLGEEHADAVVELGPYLRDAFGNATRIDYGSGHELAFVALLCCSSLLKIFTEDDAVALVTRVFNRYLNTVRGLQSKYRLEPAGSHGVWGLDDYQFLCYYWGAAQLIGQETLLPDHIPEESVAQTNGADYMFFDALRFIFKMKAGPFFEHSRYLFNISAVKTWTKVNSGLLKMYKEEVLNKFPVVQHFMFGNLLPLHPPGGSGSTLPEPTQTWGGDVPSRDAEATPPPSTSAGVPLTAFPGTGGTGAHDSITAMPINMGHSGRARVAERGSLRPRPKPE